MRSSEILFYVVEENVVGGSNMIRFPLLIAVSELDMPGIKPEIFSQVTFLIVIVIVIHASHNAS